MKIKNILLAICLAMMNISFAQQLIDTAYCHFDSVNYYSKMKLPVAMNIENASVFRHKAYNIALSEEFTHTDASGITHHKYIQKKSNVPILNSEIFVREKNGNILDATGKINVNVPENTVSLNPDNAVKLVLDATKCYKYKWDIPEYETQIKEENDNESATYYPQPELKIYKLNNLLFDVGSNYKYIYPVRISALYASTDSTFSDSVYYVDAVSSTVIKRFSPAANCYGNKSGKPQLLPTCSGDCMTNNVSLHYYGDQDISTEKFLNGLVDCTHRLKDNCTGTNLYVVKYGTSGPAQQDFRSNGNDWTASGNPSDKVGATTLWCLEKGHEFYRSVLGRESYDNGYSQMKATVYSTNMKTGWDLIGNEMSVAQSIGTSSYEATLDIIGHEITHGVGDQICYLMQDNSIAQTDEEGILGEGYGDIFGQAIEHFVHNNYSTSGAVDDYFQGSNLPGGITYQKERYAYNPNLNGHPDTYMGTYYTSVPDDIWHDNSTVVSHWYYLLAEGGSGINDISNNYCVSGIGQGKAIKIAYESLFQLGGTAKQVINARHATILAAQNLYGANSHEAAQTAAAWYAVGVGPAFGGQVNIQNMTVGAPGIIDKHYNSYVNINNVTVNPGSGSTTTFYVTSNTQIEVLPETKISPGVHAELYITPACAGGARMINPNNNQREAKTLSGTPEYFKESETLTTETKTNAKEHQFAVYPNPNNGVFKLVLDNTIHLPGSISLKDILGKELNLIQKPSHYEYDFDISNFDRGIYFLEISYPDKTLSKKIIKN